MKTSLRVLLPSFLALCVLPPGAHAQDKTPVSLATATPGGGFPVYGAAFTATVNEADPTLLVTARNTKRSAENIPLLEKDGVDIGLVQGEAAYEAFAGIGRPPANMRIIAAMYSSPGFFIVRKDSPHRSIADLKGLPVAFGAAGSGLVILARYVLDGVGLDQNKDFRAILLERAGDGPDMVRDGRAAALWGGGAGWPGFTNLMKDGNARFIAPSAAEIARITARHSFLKPLTLAAGTYPNQPEALQSVGSWSFVLARTSLPDDVAYRLARAVHTGEAAIAKRLPQASETTLANTAAAAPRADLIHPGVLRYMREVGVVR
ncbi:MAG: TAXI family TRAP transporter solute-binding subunit [Burkholderiales bacterium]|nr:TAXI family TRAP transporter solute-binding subunit [Burkholderiales bacterium]